MSTGVRLQLQEYTTAGISGRLATTGWGPGRLSPAAGSITLTRRRSRWWIRPIGDEYGRSPTTPRITTRGRRATSGCTTSGTANIRLSPITVTTIRGIAWRGASQVIPIIVSAWVVVLAVGWTLRVTTFPFHLLRIVSTPNTETFLAGLPMVRTQTLVVDSFIVGCEWQVGD